MANKFSIQEFQERIELSFPDWEYEIMEFNGYKKPATVRCKKCGRIIQLKKAGDITRKINVCVCYKRFENYHDKLQYLGEQCGFQILFDGPATQKKKIKCLKCGTIMERSLVSLLNTPEHCSNCHKYREGISHYSFDEAQEKLDKAFPQQYELLEFSGMTKEALLRHKNCGYVFKIRELGDLFEGRNRGCPKCYQFKSVGEQRIRDFLDRNGISYIPQKTFAPLNKSKYRFDFYLPEHNLVIEYQGEQHYRDNNFFRDGLDVITKRDQIKRQYCQDNAIDMLEIKYTELGNIDKILSSRFNDQR